MVCGYCERCLFFLDFFDWNNLVQENGSFLLPKILVYTQLDIYRKLSFGKLTEMESFFFPKLEKVAWRPKPVAFKLDGNQPADDFGTRGNN